MMGEKTISLFCRSIERACDGVVAEGRKRGVRSASLAEVSEAVIKDPGMQDCLRNEEVLKFLLRPWIELSWQSRIGKPRPPTKDELRAEAERISRDA